MLRATWTRGAVIVAVVAILATGAGVIAGVVPIETALDIGRTLMGDDRCTPE